jgi:segregation and condensation protein B
MEAAFEAVLFVASDPIPRGKLLEIFAEDERPAAAEALERVLARFDPEGAGGVMVEEVAGGVRLITRPEMNEWLRRFFEVSGGGKLSMAALETLAIVAYRQPVTGPEVQELRGVNPSGVLKTLLERRLVRIAGRKEVVGKPFLYCTTREFLVHFGLKSLKDLPPLEEFEEAFLGEGEGYAGEPPPPDHEEEVLRQAAILDEKEGEADDEDSEAADAPAAQEVEA